MAKKLIIGVAVFAVTATVLAGCAGSSAPSTTEGEVGGEITVLTNRTDLVDNTFEEYATQFEEANPGTSVKFEAITDYETDVSTRLSSGNYGDVLLIPNTVTKVQLAQFFEPLGSVDELSKTYRFVTEQAYDAKAYGVAITGNAQGIAYNKRIWEEAGVTELPKTPEDFLADLKAIKDSTDAIPYYTNYASDWPLSQWEGNRALTGAEAENVSLVESDTPWADDEYHGIVDGLLFDIVEGGLSEADPTTTDWESSKGLIGSGEVATMVLGSWSLTQLQDAAKTAGASADDIGYMPFPYEVDGQQFATIGGDYKNAISAKSDNKATALAWIEWFAAESGYAASQGGLSPLADGEDPETLTDFSATGVNYVELLPLPQKQATFENDIISESEIDLWGSLYRKQIIDIARGAADGDKESYFGELDTKWSEARASVAG